MTKKARKAPVATEQAKHTGTLNALKPLAKEINARFVKADQMDGKASDHRLAAALLLADAKKKAEADKLNFKKWAEEHITEQSFENVRKLVAVGQAKDPAKAIEDMRGKNADANKKSRTKTKVSRDTTEDGGAPQDRAATPFENANHALLALDDTVRLNVLASSAGDLGMTIVSEADHKQLAKFKTADKKAALGAVSLLDMKGHFDKLKASEQMDLLEYIADAVGAKVDMPTFTASTDDAVDLTPPKELTAKREPAARKRAPRKRAA